MAKNEDFNNQELISTPDVLKILLKVFGVDRIDSNKRKNLKRKIERDFQPKYETFAVKVDDDLKTNYYPKEIVVEYMNNPKTIRYFETKLKSKYYRPNKLLIAEELQELDDRKKEIYSSWEEVGLSKEDGNILQFDQFNEKKYLTVEELKQLNKKGLVFRDTLTDDEKEHLELYEYHLATNQAQDQEIEKIFKEKKLEIMITALFNQSFTLDEDLLKDDIKSVVKGGEYDPDLKRLSIDDKTTERQSVPVRRSYERLQRESNYYKEKTVYTKKKK